MKNLEIKYHIGGGKEIFHFLNTMPDVSEKWNCQQTDIYYQVPNGRLKFRRVNRKKSELIFYRRPDAPDTKSSIYEIYPSENDDMLHRILTNALGIKTIVKKQRTLLMFRNVRIHLDEVENLGNFLELESVIDKNTPLEAAKRNLHEIQQRLSRFELEPVSGSYADLLPEK